jgi:hypothetical protein
MELHCPTDMQFVNRGVIYRPTLSGSFGVIMTEFESPVVRLQDLIEGAHGLGSRVFLDAEVLHRRVNAAFVMMSLLRIQCSFWR